MRCNCCPIHWDDASVLERLIGCQTRWCTSAPVALPPTTWATPACRQPAATSPARTSCAVATATTPPRTTARPESASLGAAAARKVLLFLLLFLFHVSYFVMSNSLIFNNILTSECSKKLLHIFIGGLILWNSFNEYLIHLLTCIYSCRSPNVFEIDPSFALVITGNTNLPRWRKAEMMINCKRICHLF